MGKRIVSVSRHAYRRMKERAGIKKKAALRVAQKAYDDGVTKDSAEGRLKDWLMQVYLRCSKADNARVYGNHAFLFCDTHLITVLYVPKVVRPRNIH